MRRKIIHILLLLIVPYAGYCQYFLKIDSLLVYNIIEKEIDGVIDEGVGEGPFVYGYFTLYNQTETPFIFLESDYSMLYYYSYNGNKYSSMFLYMSMEQDSMIIKPMDSVVFTCGANLMIDVAIHKSKKCRLSGFNVINHSDIFKHVLPTLYAQILINNNRIVITSPTYAWKLTDYDENVLRAYIIKENARLDTDKTQ